MTKLQGIITQYPVSSQNENFANTGKRLRENKTWIPPAVRYSTWKLEFLSNIFPAAVASYTNHSTHLQSTDL